MLAEIIAAILAFFFEKAKDEAAIGLRNQRIDDGAKKAEETGDTSDLEDALS